MKIRKLVMEFGDPYKLERKISDKDIGFLHYDLEIKLKKYPSQRVLHAAYLETGVKILSIEGMADADGVDFGSCVVNMWVSTYFESVDDLFAYLEDLFNG